MPWLPLPQIAFAVATYPFTAQDPADLPLELGDELYVIEKGGKDGEWYRGYLVAPPSLLVGLTTSTGQTLEARVFSGIFPRSCVEVREILGDDDSEELELKLLSLDMNDHIFKSDDLMQEIKPLTVTKSKSNLRRKDSAKRKTWKQNSINNKHFLPQEICDSILPKPPAPVPMLKIGDETPTCIEQPLVDEIASCLREWHSTHLHRLLLAEEYQSLNQMACLVRSLDAARKQLLYGSLTKYELAKLQEKVVWDLVRGNKMFADEVIIRDPSERGRIMTTDDSIIDVTQLQSIMSLLDEKPLLNVQERSKFYHLLVEVKNLVGTSTENTTLVIFLASKASDKPYEPLSENYIVEVPPTIALASLAKTEVLRTLFVDLTGADIGELSTAENDLYLVVKVQSRQQIYESRSKERRFSRDGPPYERLVPQTASTIGKAGLKSLIWAGKVQRNTFSRHLPSTPKSFRTSDFRHSLSHSRDGSLKSFQTIHTNNDGVCRSAFKTNRIGAFKINDIINKQDECEIVMNMWAPVPEYRESLVENLEEVIQESNNFENSERTERLQLNIKSFNFLDSETLITAKSTLLSDVVVTKKMGFLDAPTKPRSDIYITIDEAFLPRQSLLSRAIGNTGGVVPLSQNISGFNLQVKLEVRNLKGERLEGCIFPSSNCEPQSSWESTVVVRGDSWKQTVRLAIPESEVPTSHLFMLLTDVPHDPFAFCYLPLWDEQAFIHNDQYSLLLYGYNENKKIMKGLENKVGYISHPWNSRGNFKVGRDEVRTGPIATLRIKTYLCSTTFLQNNILLDILKWKELSQRQVQELLKRLVFVPEIEIVKMLNDVFNAIFGILVDQAGNNDCEDLGFSALITVLGIIYDRRFNIGPLVDQYAENEFYFPLVMPCLARSLTRLLAKPSDPDTSRQLRATFKVVKYILKFITRAKEQQKEIEAAGTVGPTKTTSLTRNLRGIFKALDAMMRSEAPILIGSKTLAVQHFHTWLPELLGLLNREEIVHVAIDFMDSCSAVKGKLILYKLILIINYSKLDIFSEKEQRKALCMNTVRWIEPLWEKTDEVEGQWRDQVRLCCSIVASQVQDLVNEIPDYIPKIINSFSQILKAGSSLLSSEDNTRFSLLFPTTYPFPSKPILRPSKFDEVLVELSAVLSAVSMQPAGIQLELAADEMAKILQDTLNVHLSILNCEAFPASWLSVYVYHHRSTMKTLEYIGGILIDSFIPDPEDAEQYNTELWKIFFTVLLKVIGSDILALETFPEQKRRAVWKIAGDIRETGAELMQMTWDANGWETTVEEKFKFGLSKVGGYQVQYVPYLIGPIIELCLSVHEGVRKVAVDILRTIIVSEWNLNEDISIIQAEIIDCLDRIFRSKRITESTMQKLFIVELEQLFAPLSKHRGDPLYIAQQELITKTSEFLDLLVAVHSSETVSDAAHLINYLRLIEFLRDMQKEDILMSYINKLAQLQSIRIY
ncbi:Dedicator of cytokinesis protein 1 [Erysiphe neolycopersici]|uniref:Dedicator of cytokinesis protein 1 n=1 Tax=Erysiphe neolycopersici TaxID=212602 RepID=A0A420HJY5_9PEZI|nr:Dedicator of cytokinesis protein 1 [Erysiphe neolycopersici]